MKNIQFKLDKTRNRGSIMFIKFIQYLDQNKKPVPYVQKNFKRSKKNTELSN